MCRRCAVFTAYRSITSSRRGTCWRRAALYFLPTAGISLFAHRKNGYLDKAVLRAAIPTGTLCALAAAFLTTMVDSSVFRKPFGLFLLYAGLSILFEKKKNSKKETP